MFNLAILVTILLGVLCFISYVLAPLSPLMTSLFVILGTALAFKRTSTEILAFTGFALYAASWFAIPVFGKIGSAVISGSGILIWLLAVSLSVASIIKSKPVQTI
jgi:hypothetical protein